MPKYALRAHTAPLDIEFYDGSDFPGLSGSAFVASHGSWNRFISFIHSLIHVFMIDWLLTGKMTETQLQDTML